MIKPKEWLYQNGHMTREEADKRGRMSLANKALVMEAVRNGVAIEGYAIVDRPTVATDKPAKVERVAVDPNRVMDVPDMSRDETALMAFYRADGKVIEIGMRTVDNVCGNSLTYCRCESPRVWVDCDSQVVVNFKPRN